MTCRHGMRRDWCGHCSGQTPMPSRYGTGGIRRITARYDGTCEACDRDTHPGDVLVRDLDDTAWVHEGCLEEDGDDVA